jgi:hypothetical protein
LENLTKPAKIKSWYFKYLPNIEEIENSEAVTQNPPGLALMRVRFPPPAPIEYEGYGRLT